MKITNTTKKKTKYVLFVMIITYSFIFSGINHLLDFPVSPEVPEIYYNPLASDYLYEDNLSDETLEFNAYNESYIVCKVKDTAFANFTFEGTTYNISYGMNYIPIDFGEENETHYIYLDDKDNYEWFAVEPVILDEGLMDINPTTKTNISFKSAGLISFLITWNCTELNNFTYDELYVEYDGIVLNEIREDWDHSLELDPSIIASFMFDGTYIQFDIFSDVGEHTISLKGNATVDYKIIVEGDWDGDGYSNVKEVQQVGDMDIPTLFVPVISGYFLKGENNKFIQDIFRESGLFTFLIPKSYSDDNYFRMKISSGSIKNIIVDDDDITFKNIETNITFYDAPQTLYYGRIDYGVHYVKIDYSEQCISFVRFYINGSEIAIRSMPSFTDTDCDGLTDEKESMSSTSFELADSDGDGALDGFDNSPSSSLLINNSKITQIILPTNISRDTIISLSIKKMTKDYTTTSKIWNDMSVSVMPMLRIFGNSSIQLNDIAQTYEKEIEKMIMINSDEIYADNVPSIYSSDSEYVLISPSISNTSITYNFPYYSDNDAKTDSKINLLFDFVWGIISHENNISSVIQMYDIDEPIELQSLISIEISPMNYILASPDSMIENNIFQTLIANPNVGTYSDFSVSDDVVGDGISNYSHIFDDIFSLRESNPINTDENGVISETEVLYLSYMFSQYDILNNISNIQSWISVPNYLGKNCKIEAYVSNFIVNPCSIEDMLPFSPNTMDSDNFNIHYTKEYVNVSEVGDGLEERLNIIDYPIHMNVDNFDEGNVSETLYVEGRNIPIEGLPSTLESEIHDKITLMNKTLIEKNDNQKSINSLISFDPFVDIIKESTDMRRVSVPFSDIIFNEYSIPVVSVIVNAFKNIANRFREFIVDQYYSSLFSLPKCLFTSVFDDTIFESIQYNRQIIKAWMFGSETIAFDEIIKKFGIFDRKDWDWLLEFETPMPFPKGKYAQGSSNQYSMLVSALTEGLRHHELSAVEYYNSRIDLFKKLAVGESMDIHLGYNKRISGFKSLIEESMSLNFKFDLANAMEEETGELLAILREPIKLKKLFTDYQAGDTSFFVKRRLIIQRIKEIYNPQILDGIIAQYQKNYENWALELENALAGNSPILPYDEQDFSARYLYNNMDDGTPKMQRLQNIGQMRDDWWSKANQKKNQKVFFQQMTDYADDMEKKLSIVEKRVSIKEKVVIDPESEIKVKKAIQEKWDNEIRDSRRCSPYWTGFNLAMAGFMIWSAVVDFNEAQGLLNEGDETNAEHRFVLGVLKTIIAGGIIAQVIGKNLIALGVDMIGKISVEAVTKFATWGTQVVGFFLNLIMFFDLKPEIENSNIMDWQKNLCIELLKLGLVLDGVCTILMGLSLLSGCLNVIPLIGFVIDIAFMICYAIFFPATHFSFSGINLLSGTKIELGSNVKKNGGIRVGDTVRFIIDGESIQEVGNTYLQDKINLNSEGWSNWDGNYATGYEYEDPIYTEVEKTLTQTNTQLNISIWTQMAVDIYGEKTEIFNDATDTFLNVPILNENIEYFYGNLTDDPNDEYMKSYQELRTNLTSYLDTYKFKEQSDLSLKLSNSIARDCRSGESFSETEDGEGIFRRILRLNDVNDNSGWTATPSTSDFEDNIDDIDILFENNYAKLEDYIEGENGDYIIFDVEDITNIECDLVKSITISAFGQQDYNSGLLDLYIGWRYNSSTSWNEAYYELGIDDEENYQTLWDDYTWSSLNNPNDLDDLQVRIRCHLDGSSTSYYDICNIYLDVTYENYDDDSESVLIDEFNGHYNVSAITTYGNWYSETSVYDSFSSQSDGIIDFWLFKDNATYVEIEDFFIIDFIGSIWMYDFSTYIRYRPIPLYSWNHFSIDFNHGEMDLYVNGILVDEDIECADQDTDEIRFTVYTNYENEVPYMGHISEMGIAYIDAIDYSWDTDWYRWRSYAHDYLSSDIDYYEDFYDDLPIHTTISTDLSENVIEMNTSTYIADFDFYFTRDGTDNPKVDVKLFNIPEGFSINDDFLDNQDLTALVSFEISDTGTHEYAGTYWFDMNITLHSTGELIYYERVPFIIPLIEDLDYDYSNYIYEDNSISSGEYTSIYSFTDDSGSPDGWSTIISGGTVSVISYLGGHTDVVELHDTSGNDHVDMYQTTTQVNGTIDFWMRTDDASKRIGIQGSEYPFQTFAFAIYDDAFCFYNSTNDWQNIENTPIPEDNTWYHITLDFECGDGKYKGLSNDTFRIYIDGIPYGTFNSSNDRTHIDRILFGTEGSLQGYYGYIDAIGYSWDTNYMIGDNNYETDTSVSITESQVNLGDLIDVSFRTNTYSETQIKLVNNDVVQKVYTLLPRGNTPDMIHTKSILIDSSITFDEIRFTEYEYNYFDVLEIRIVDTYGTTSQSFNPVDITNDGNAPEFVSFSFSGVENSSFIETILPSEEHEISLSTSLPTEPNNNLIYRGLNYGTLYSNKFYEYIDNFEISGIHIASPKNVTYNIIGNNYSCNQDQFVLDIIPEETLVWSAYSVDGGENITFSGSTNVSLPQTNGMHSIQVFGNNSAGTMFESEVRNFTISYPIGFISPDEDVWNIERVPLLREYYGFSNDMIGENPEDWTIQELASQYGYVKVDALMNGMSDIVEVRNKGYNYEVSALKTFDNKSSMGLVEFNLLRESDSYRDTIKMTLLGEGGSLYLTIEYENITYGEHGLFSRETLLGTNITDSDVWHSFEIAFDTTRGVQITIDGKTYGEHYTIPFTTGCPTNITGFKIETQYDSYNPRDYGFWLDNFAVYEIEEGLLVDLSNPSGLSDLEYSIDGENGVAFENPNVFPEFMNYKNPDNDGVSMIDGTFDDSDNMKADDNSYSVFESNEGSFISDEYLYSISYTKGSSGAGTIENTQTDNGNYKQINPKSTYYGYPVFDYCYDIDIKFNLENGYSGRDFYFSFHAVSSSPTMYLYESGGSIASGTTIDFDDMYLEDVSEIRLVAHKWSSSFNVKVYYFLMVEDATPTPAELNFTIDLNFNNLNNSEVLGLNVISHHHTNVSTNIQGEIYNFTDTSYMEMFSSTQTTETEEIFTRSVLVSDFLNGSNILKLRYRGANNSKTFKLYIDYLEIQFYYKLSPTVHSIIAYGIDVYGNVYRSENKSITIPYIKSSSPANTDVSIVEGTFDNTDNMKADDDIYSIFDSTGMTPIPNEWLYSITYTKGEDGGGSLANTQTNDSNYQQINGEGTYYGYPIYDWGYDVDINFNIEDGYNGRDFYFSFHAESVEDMYLEVNGQVVASGTDIEFADMFITDVNSIRLFASKWYDNFNVKVYYFKIFEDTFSTPAELNYTIDLDFSAIMNKDLWGLSLTTQFYTNVSTYIRAEIYNATAGEYVNLFYTNQITEAEIISINDYQMLNASDFLNGSGHVIIRITGINYYEGFRLYMDYMELSFYYT